MSLSWCCSSFVSLLRAHYLVLLVLHVLCGAAGKQGTPVLCTPPWQWCCTYSPSIVSKPCCAHSRLLLLLLSCAGRHGSAVHTAPVFVGVVLRSGDLLP
jgi:hypothetical protein